MRGSAKERTILMRFLDSFIGKPRSPATDELERTCVDLEAQVEQAKAAHRDLRESMIRNSRIMVPPEKETDR